MIGRRNMLGTAGGDPVEKPGAGFIRNDAQPGARLPKQPRLGQGLIAAADDDHGFALDPHENGESVKPGCILCHCGQQFRGIAAVLTLSA